MKVIGINGSSRKDGNTAIAIKKVFNILENAGIETELIQLAGETITGCTGCYGCFINKNNQCVNKSDIINECIEKMHSADGIILGTPVYFADVTAGMKALIERAGYVSMANKHLFKHKVGVAVTAARRGGAIHAGCERVGLEPYLYVATFDESPVSSLTLRLENSRLQQTTPRRRVLRDKQVFVARSVC